MRNDLSIKDARRRHVVTGAATLAGAGALVSGGAAHAQVQVTALSTPLTATTSTPVFFNLEGGIAQTTSFTGAEFELTHTTSGGFDFADIAGLDSNSKYMTHCVLSGGDVTNYGAGIAVGPPAPMTLSDYTTGSSDIRDSQNGGGFALGTPGYVGLDEIIGGQNHYGWAEVTVDDGTTGPAAYDVTLNAFAINTVPEQGVLAGTDIAAATPEPSALELVVLGATGLGALRLRRRAAGAAAA